MATRRQASASQTPQGKPRNRSMASPRIIGSLIRIAMPPRSALAAPTPMNQVPSVAMNDGMRSLTWITPLTKPMPAPTSSTTSDADQAVVVAVRPVQHQHRQDHRRRGQHALDREVDRAHQDDEGRPDPEHQRDHRRLADPDGVAEGEEVRVDRGDDGAERHQHRQRRPGRDPPAARGCLGSPPVAVVVNS